MPIYDSLTCGHAARAARRSLTWDQGAEMVQYAQLRVDTGMILGWKTPAEALNDHLLLAHQASVGLYKTECVRDGHHFAPA